MIKLEKTDVVGWESAIRGMRNPMNSWDKSDSEYRYWCDCLGPDEEPHYCTHCKFDQCSPYTGTPDFVIGENDLKLMKSLSKAGSDHAKYLRMINVTVDVTAPLYWWKEYDTYKVGTVANSCSTMHKIHDKPFEIDDFSCEHLKGMFRETFEELVKILNCARNVYNNRDKKYKEDWYQMIQLLPTSYNQKRTVQLNYQVLKNMYHARKTHKLDEWREFCKWIEGLPYSELITEERENNDR